MDINLINICYLVAAILFIVGLKMLSSPKTASFGNFLGALGMLIAIVATMVDRNVVDFEAVIVGLIIGSIIGTIFAYTTKMTAMPQMVALLNGFGGAASALVAGAELFKHLLKNETVEPILSIPIALSIIIGAITLTGSVIAFAKLQELMRGRPITYPLQKTINLLLGLSAVGCSIWLIAEPSSPLAFWGLNIISAVLGILLVLPIGGADMPVVISLLNSYSGIAGMTTGFVLGNNVLIISGSLVGASGIILCQLMCKAMNRSMVNVLFGAFGKTDEKSGISAGSDKSVRGYSIEDATICFEGASLVIIVPGYGMAVAQAQHVVRELADVLAARGTTVKYAIHPVAGRMPGHMNVLLAEANVPYDQLYEMDTINPSFPEADVALVVGANDITNPAARTNKTSPLYGMPILDVDRARTVMVCKRSMAAGFAGVDNELYYNPKTMMLFGDAKDTITKLARALKR